MLGLQFMTLLVQQLDSVSSSQYQATHKMHKRNKMLPIFYSATSRENHSKKLNEFLINCI